MPPRRSAPSDGFHGLGGVSFEGDTGASSHLELAEDHAQMEIHFLRQPGGGVLAVEAGGQKLGEVETDGPDKQPDYQTFPLNAGRARDRSLGGARTGSPLRRQFRKKHAGRDLQ